MGGMSNACSVAIYGTLRLSFRSVSSLLRSNLPPRKSGGNWYWLLRSERQVLSEVPVRLQSNSGMWSNRESEGSASRFKVSAARITN